MKGVSPATAAQKSQSPRSALDAKSETSNVTEAIPVTVRTDRIANHVPSLGTFIIEKVRGIQRAEEMRKVA